MEDPEKRRAAIGTGAVLDSRGGVPERFRIIRVHGLDWNRIRDWAAPDRTNVETVLGETRMKPINKSRIRVLLDDLPQSSQDDFDATGKTEIDLLTLLSSAREKASGGPPPNPIGG